MQVQRMIYAYGDAVVIRRVMQVEGLLHNIQEIQVHLDKHDQ